MKSVLIIGMGRFGHYLCEEMLEQGNEIMIVDKDEEAIEDMVSNVTSALIADCTKESTLKKLGVSNFDVCFVCIGEDFQRNLEITSLLKELGAQYVVSKSNSEIHTKFLLRNGADEVIHPDKDIAERAAVKFSNDNISDYIELQDGYSIYEITPLNEWVGKSLKESNIRAVYKVVIIGVIDADGETNITPSPDYVINSEDHLMVIAHEDDMAQVIKKFEEKKYKGKK